MSDPLFQDHTPRLGLPLLFAGQSQREIFVNEALARLDALVDCAIEAQLPAPPAAPAEGKSWLVATGASGAWTGQGGAIACLQQGQWLFQPPVDGLRLLNKATGQYLHYLGSWRMAAKPSSPTGGTVIDVQARSTIGALITALVEAGILAAQ